MTTRLTYVTLLALMLPLAPYAPSNLLAQADDEAKSPAVAGRGRQVIVTKLERIRLDTVAYDGLPLSEIVRNLRDESRRRDPEKKGLNFIINPNAAPGAEPLGPPGAPPPEQLDIGSINIKINPPLNDVRLVDVLDAVVKVAERPIQYAIEDYAVIFSAKKPDLSPRDVIGFTFQGGTPNDFLNAVQKQYKVDWSSVVDIPKEMADVTIPRLRITPDDLTPILQRRSGNESGALGALVSLYNQLGEQKPELGRLIVKGDLSKPSVVMFVPDKAVADLQPKLKVKAFSIYGISPENRDKLQLDIDRAKSRAMEYASRLRGAPGLRYLEGTVAIHNDTSLLVATGTDSFVEMVESIVIACQAKESDRPKK